MAKFQRAGRVFMGAGSQNFRTILLPSLVVSRDCYGLAWEMIKKKKKVPNKKVHSYHFPILISSTYKHKYTLQ